MLDKFDDIFLFEQIIPFLQCELYGVNRRFMSIFRNKICHSRDLCECRLPHMYFHVFCHKYSICIICSSTTPHNASSEHLVAIDGVHCCRHPRGVVYNNLMYVDADFVGAISGVDVNIPGNILLISKRMYINNTTRFNIMPDENNLCVKCILPPINLRYDIIYNNLRILHIGVCKYTQFHTIKHLEELKIQNIVEKNWSSGTLPESLRKFVVVNCNMYFVFVTQQYSIQHVEKPQHVVIAQHIC